MSSVLPKVKICGVTRLQDAELAAELGAWAVGMVFYDSSPRQCSMPAALEIASSLRRRVELCGVFVNAPFEQIAATVQELELTLVQLHGDEGPSFCAEVSRRTGARVIKAVQVRNAGDVQDAKRFRTDFHLLDASGSSPHTRDLRGGTGETFDWTLLAARRSRVPLILSGGLNPDNVADAIAATARRRLFAVDTASGTEAAPGRKSPEKMRAFFAEVDRANGLLEAGAGAGSPGAGSESSPQPSPGPTHAHALGAGRS
jgi:phosphoribosylanthranilate isomerase